MGVERLRWVFPAGSNIAPGDTAVGARVAIAVPVRGRYRIRVRVTDSTGAYSDASMYISTTGVLGPKGLTRTGGLRVVPNPANGRVRVETTLPGPIGLLDGLGRTLYRTQGRELELGGLPAGLFFILQGRQLARVSKE